MVGHIMYWALARMDRASRDVFVLVWVALDDHIAHRVIILSGNTYNIMKIVCYILVGEGHLSRHKRYSDIVDGIDAV